MDERRVLVSTIAPVSGGVPTMAHFITDTLQAGGWTPVLAHYEPYGVTPQLSVPSVRLGRGRPGTQRRTTWGSLETHAMGAWLPELEFTHYWPSILWRELMAGCNRFVAVCGNVLAALPFARTGRPFTAWVATGWEEDRNNRVRHFPIARRLLDRCINAPVLRRREREVLRKGEILALSEHTRGVLDGIAGSAVCRDVLPMPIDSAFFRPDPARIVPRRIGFTGRLDDPRKNLGLLIEAMACLAKAGQNVQAMLIGGEPGTDIARSIAASGLADRIHFVGYAPREQVRELLQSFDVFVVPSYQEGLCIAALEAMACGCPVVSTRCGGPEEFVRDGDTGYLVDFNGDEMSTALAQVINVRKLRDRLSQNARSLVLERYSQERCESVFWNTFENHNNSEEAVS